MNILRRLFILFDRFSLIEKILYSFLLVVIFKHTTQAIFNWIYQLFKDITNWISHHSQQIIVATAIIFGIFLLGAGCFLYFTRRKTARNLLDEGVDDEDIDDKYLLKGNYENQDQTIYTEGNYNENIYGDYVEIHGHQININNDFAEVAAQIQELVNQLKNQGYSQEEAEEEIAQKLEEKSLNNTKFKRTLRRWRASFSKKSNAASDKEVAQDVVQSATSYSYTSSKDFTDVVGGDFHRLNELLQSKKWEEADWETAKIIYAIAQHELPNSHHYTNYPPDYIVEEHIKVIPKKYLKNIDSLWKKHSNGRFGFSIQKRIVKSLRKEEESSYSSPFYSYDTVDKFGDLVGWRKDEDWLYYVDLYDSLKTAAPGHLPLAYMLRSDKLEKCEIDFDIFDVIYERL
jgi:hypothetical protein